MSKQRSPAKELEAFLNFVDDNKREYDYAYGMVNEEDRKLTDMVHEIEFAENAAERNKVATRIQNSRRARRKNKDIVTRNKALVEFFEDQNHKKTLNALRQLLGKQRREEEYLESERTYKKRVDR